MTAAPDLCQPWIGSAEVRCIEKFSALTDQQIAPMLMPASEICYKLSGRNFPGLCTLTDVRPCLQSPVFPLLPHNLSELLVLWWGSCGCGGQPWTGGCGCSQGIFSIDLAPYVPTSIEQVSEVRIDGAVFTAWTVLDKQFLARTDGMSWPLAQQLNLPSTERFTWAVDLEFGTPPPEDAQLACAILCGEMALSLNPGSGDCALPQRIQSITRQGVTYLVADPQQYLADSKTGIYLIDLWLEATNPGRTRSKAFVSYPGKGGLPGRRRT